MSEPSGGPDPHAAAKLAYGQVAEAHQAITDFRAKLLALLPIASGAGIFILLGGAAETAAADLAAIGLFGLAVTLGLFMYELRGIQQCHRLREQAASLEDALGFAAGTAPFRDRPSSRLAGIVGVESASWIVYVAVIAAWVYVAGSSSLWEDGRGIALGVAYLVVLAFAWSRSARGRAALLSRRRHDGRDRAADAPA